MGHGYVRITGYLPYEEAADSLHYNGDRGLHKSAFLHPLPRNNQKVLEIPIPSGLPPYRSFHAHREYPAYAHLIMQLFSSAHILLAGHFLVHDIKYLPATAAGLPFPSYMP